MLILALSALVYFFLLVLAPALLWKSGNRLMDALALRGQIQRSINSAQISRQTNLSATSISEKLPALR
jgi:hypothetical protein